jgi:hypothetical protein
MYTKFLQFHLQHFNVQWTMCLLNIRFVCGPKGNIPTASFKYCIVSKKRNINWNTLNKTFQQLLYVWWVKNLQYIELKRANADSWQIGTAAVSDERYGYDKIMTLYNVHINLRLSHWHRIELSAPFPTLGSDMSLWLDATEHNTATKGITE